MNIAATNTKGIQAEKKRFEDYQTVYLDAQPEEPLPPDPNNPNPDDNLPPMNGGTPTNRANATISARRAKYGPKGMSRAAMARAMANDHQPNQ